MKYIYPISSVRLSELYTIKNIINEEDLIRKVGHSLFLSFDFKKYNKILIFVGKGNNGADGLSLALNLIKNNKDVCIFLLEDIVSIVGLKLYDECIENKIPIFRYLNDINIGDYDLIIDAIYGVGFHNEMDEYHKTIVNLINDSKAYIVSIDINSGLNAINGIALNAIKSDLTLAIELLKPGYFLNDAKDYIKELKVVDVGIVSQGEYYNLLTIDDFNSHFLKRKENTHKGSYGYSAIFGGSENYSGALKLSSMSLSSLIMGSGVSRIIIPRDILSFIAPNIHESTIYPVESINGHIIYNAKDASESIKGISSLGFGMGLKDIDNTKKYLEYILKNYEGRLLIDADGINALSEMDLELLNESKSDIVLTPHIKEFSRLAKIDIKDIINDPIKSVIEFTKRYNVTLLLKGTTTIISYKGKVNLVDKGSPSLSKGGSGDILSGIITGIMSYNKDVFTSASLGAFIHGMMGEKLYERYGSYSSLPSDEIRLLKEYMSELGR